MLRLCLVPSLNYHLRCIAPSCAEDEARLFDQRVMETAMDKLGLDGEERRERTITMLQRKLRDGGWSLTSAARTSPAAFPGSLAACHAEPAFSTCGGDTAVPYASQLQGWLDDSLQRVRQAAPGDKYLADIEPLLPVTAGLFSASTPPPTTPPISKLQHTLNAKAAQHNVEAAVQRMKEQSRRGDRWEWTHHKDTRLSPRMVLGDGKAARPGEVQQRLSDVEYAIAARLNLGLNPFPARAMNALPEHCPLCTHLFTGKPVSLRDDPWHWLHHQWVGVVGAVVGRDDTAIRAGMHSVLSAAGNRGVFLRRLQLDEMPMDPAVLLLRQCMVPAMNYFLRCVAPVCIEEEAREFDQRVMDAAMTKLGLHDFERNERTATLLQRELRDGGGWGLTPAARTSPAAFLGSLAACHAAPTFVPYCEATPLPPSSQLHAWIDDSQISNA